MLPKSIKKRVMDYAEAGLENISGAVDPNHITKRINL